MWRSLQCTDSLCSIQSQHLMSRHQSEVDKVRWKGFQQHNPCNMKTHMLQLQQQSNWLQRRTFSEANLGHGSPSNLQKLYYTLVFTAPFSTLTHNRHRPCFLLDSSLLSRYPNSPHPLAGRRHTMGGCGWPEGLRQVAWPWRSATAEAAVHSVDLRQCWSCASFSPSSWDN
jgi:hypothetical protein